MRSAWAGRRSIHTGTWCGRWRPPKRSNRIFPSSNRVLAVLWSLEFPMKAPILRLLAIGAGAMLLTSAYVRIPSSSIMETAAKNFLNSLTPQQRAQATYKFDDDQRFDWHFIPKAR